MVRSVHFQTWIKNPESSTWKLASEAIDDGNTGCGSDDPKLKYHTQPVPAKD